MNDDICWLVTVLCGDTLLRCALQVKRDALPGDCAEYPMEPENRKTIHALLPLHVKTCGPIVAVDELFEVHIANTPPRPATQGKGACKGCGCPVAIETPYCGECDHEES